MYVELTDEQCTAFYSYTFQCVYMYMLLYKPERFSTMAVWTKYGKKEWTKKIKNQIKTNIIYFLASV